MSIVDRALSILGLERRAFGSGTTQTSFGYTDATLQELTDDTGKPVGLRNRCRAVRLGPDLAGFHGGGGNATDA